MRIHTTLDWTDMLNLLHAGLPGVSYRTLSEHGSRIRPHAFEVSLTGNGYRTNTGQYGAGDENGATWDEWGVMFARLYAADPTAVCGGTVKRPQYRDAAHYHWSTGDRFTSGELPADTHKRHVWRSTGTPGAQACAKCTATMNYDLTAYAA